MKRAHHENVSDEVLDLFSLKRLKIQEELGVKRTFPTNHSQGTETPFKQRRIITHFPHVSTDGGFQAKDNILFSTYSSLKTGKLLDFLSRDQHRLTDHTLPNSEGFQLVVYQPPLVQPEVIERAPDQADDTMDTT